MATRAVEARTRRYDPAETRQRVLEAANQLFSTKGFVATGTADIARAADVSEGSIFYHFGSKKNLLIELGRMYGERMVEAMHQGEDLADLTIETTIRRCFDYCATHKAWEAILGGGECGINTSRKGEHFHAPEAEPFYRASREVVVGWIEAHMVAQFARSDQAGVNIPVAASLVYAAVGDALDRAFAPGADPAEREAVLVETIRFVSRACDYR
jgi:AcrR family transcriptional regulator